MGSKRGGRQPFGAMQLQQLLRMMGKGGGKGKTFSPSKGGKVVSKFGKKPQTQKPKAAKVEKTPAEIKILEKLRETDSSLKVWVGGLNPGSDWKKLQQHFQKNGSKPKVVHVNARGTAVVTFDSEDKVGEAIATLNGSNLGGKKIEVDVWTKPDKADRENKPKKSKSERKKAALLSTKKKGSKQKKLKTVAKAAVKPKVDEKILEKLREVDASLKVWVGGLAKSTTWKALRAHFVQASAKPKIVHVNERRNNGVVTFAEESEVQEAIGLLNGSELDGKTIELDVWAKPEREKKGKAKD